jgi:hypothetical protein
MKTLKALTHFIATIAIAGVIWCGSVQKAQAFVSTPLIMIICTNPPIVTTTNAPSDPFPQSTHIPIWQIVMPPANPPFYPPPIYPQDITPINNGGGSGSISYDPPNSDTRTRFASGPGSCFIPDQTAPARFSIDSAVGNGTNWSKYSDGAIIGDGDVINISFDPLLDHIPTNWVAFSVNYQEGTNITAAAAMMDGYCSVGSWTFRVTGTNPVSIALTNAACRSSIGTRIRYPSLHTYRLPKGVDAVDGAVEIPIKVNVSLGETYTLEYKTAYIPGLWTTLTNIVSDTSNTDSNNVMSLSLSSGGATELFLRIRSSDNCSSVIGYNTVTVPAGKSALVANQFASTDTRVPALLSGSATGSYVAEFSQTNGWTTNHFDGTNWTIANAQITPGGGVFYHNAGTNDITITFAGLVLYGGIATTSVGNSGLYSGIFPRNCNLTDNNFPAKEGDMVYKYNSVSDTYDTFTYVDGAWSPSTPEFAPGEAFAVEMTNSARWVASIEIYPKIEGPFGPEIANYMYDDLITYQGSTGPWETNYFIVRSTPGTTVDIETSTEGAAGPWSTETTVNVGLSQVAIAEIPGDGREQLFFRIHWPSTGPAMRMMSLPATEKMTKGVIEELLQLADEYDAKETAASKTTYYLASLLDGPPVPGDQGFPVLAYEENIVILDDSSAMKKQMEINQGKAAAVFAEIRKKLWQPLPSWLTHR